MPICSDGAVTITQEYKVLLKNKIPYYAVVVTRDGSECRLEALGEEAAELEREVKKRKSHESTQGASPKIFVGGNGSPSQPPAALCNKQL
ncbi:MAG: hypothetical protein ACREAZ_08195, partial [Nitrososphaera sp.]